MVETTGTSQVPLTLTAAWVVGLAGRAERAHDGLPDPWGYLPRRASPKEFRNLNAGQREGTWRMGGQGVPSGSERLQKRAYSDTPTLGGPSSGKRGPW